MEAQNLTSQDFFLIVGFSDLPQLQVSLFVIVLLIYLITLAGNLLVLAIVYNNSHLHTPMYFFLTNLSFIDISNNLIIFPQMLVHFFSEGIKISFTKCFLQVYFLIAVMGVEIHLLSVMAYDRYVAICKPLHYMTVMNKAACIQLAAGTWAVGLLQAIPHTVQISKLSFCGSHTIEHFYCDVTALMMLSCGGGAHTVELLNYIVGSLVTVLSFVLIIISYINIITSILKIKSTAGQQKTFSTCASHLSVVTLFYGSIASTYMRPTSTISMKYNKGVAFLYLAVTPLCNPIIYTVKNKEFKKALGKTKNSRIAA